MLRITFKNEMRFIEQMRQRGPQIISVLSSKLSALMFLLGSKIQTERLSGQTLGVKTGMLRGSVRAIPAELSGTKITAGVEAGGGPAGMYAGVHEFGGTRTYEIMAVKSRALAFLQNGKQSFYRRVSHPPAQARPYMTKALEDFGPEIISSLNEAINKVVSE